MLLVRGVRSGLRRLEVQRLPTRGLRSGLRLAACCLWGAGVWACGARSAAGDGTSARRVEAGDASAARCDDPERCADLCIETICSGDACTSAPKSCDDLDPCTLDSCDSGTGECRHERVSEDADGDGFFARPQGVSPLDAFEQCGRDCDDSSPLAYPGGTEVCDGLDNDCDGEVDEGAVLSGEASEPRVVSTPGVSASLGGWSVGAGFYAFFLTEDAGHQQGRVIGLDALGNTVMARADVARVNSDNFAGPMAWTGKSFGLAWEDRRDDAYEIYFNRIDVSGNKLGQDLRVTYQPAFSINPSMRFTGSEFMLFWQDRRSGSYGIYGRRITRNGELNGSEVLLTPDFENAEGATTAVGTNSVALAFNTGLSGDIHVRFVGFELELFGASHQIVEGGANAPSLRYHNGSYYLTWAEYHGSPGTSIWAAAFSEQGEITIPPARIAGPGGYMRSASMLPLGDGFSVFWSEHDGASYDIYRRSLSAQLEPTSDPIRVTNTPNDAVGPGAAFAEAGTLGVTYVERVGGVPRVMVQTLGCQQVP